MAALKLDSLAHTNKSKLRRGERVFAETLDAAGKRWVAQPCSFPLRTRLSNTYRPDFYIYEDDVFVEVVGTPEQFGRCADRVAAFRAAFPHLQLELREVYDWKGRPPTHPGNILLEEFLQPLKLPLVEAARRARIPVQQLKRIIRGRLGLSAKSAIRLSALTGASPEFWMQLQNAVDLYRAKQEMAAAGK